MFTFCDTGHAQLGKKYPTLPSFHVISITIPRCNDHYLGVGINEMVGSDMYQSLSFILNIING